MALTVGAVIFVVIVIGGMGSLAGAFVASVLLGVIETFAVGSDHSIADLLAALGWRSTPDDLRLRGAGASRSAQVAPILPYLLLVLILIFRPKGLLGTREG